MKFRLVATTLMGLEAVLKRECEALAFENIQVSDTKVEFDGTLKTICKANMWLRTAGRVYVKMAHFKALSFDDLFEKSFQCHWADWISQDGQFPVAQVTSKHSVLFSKSDCQAIVKKAIVKKLQKFYSLQHLPETGAVFPIRIFIDKDWVSLYLDTSGSGLNKRGYRSLRAAAPLRETLAAGLVYLSRYHPEKDVLWDPFCGSGTISIEAALMATNTAPGLKRSFNSQAWACMPQSYWKNEYDAACEAVKPRTNFEIIGTDLNQNAIDLAKHNAKLAGLDLAKFYCIPLSALKKQQGKEKLVSNPPYGHRLKDIEVAEALYQQLGSVMRRCFKDWSYYFLSPSESFETLFGSSATKKRKLYNGGIKCWYYQYFH